MSNKDKMKESLDDFNDYDQGLSSIKLNELIYKKNFEASQEVSEKKIEKNNPNETRDMIDHIEISTRLQKPLESLDLEAIEQMKRNNNFVVSGSVREPMKGKMMNSVETLIQEMGQPYDNPKESQMDTINDKDDEEHMLFNPIVKAIPEVENESVQENILEKEPQTNINKMSGTISQMLRSLDNNNRHSKLEEEDEEEKENIIKKPLKVEERISMEDFTLKKETLEHPPLIASSILKKPGESPKKGQKVQLIDLDDNQNMAKPFEHIREKNNFPPENDILGPCASKMTDSLTNPVSGNPSGGLFALFSALNNIRGFCRHNLTSCDAIGGRIDQCFKKICPCSKGRYAFTRYFFMILIVFSIIMAGFIGGTNDSEKLSRARTTDRLKLYLGKNLLSAAIIFTYYGIVFLEIRHRLIHILLFLGQFVPFTVLWIYELYRVYGSKSIGYLHPETFFIYVLLSSLYVFWLLVFLIKENLKKNISGTSHFMFMIMFFLFFGTIMLGMTIYEVCTADVLDYVWLNYYVSNYSAPYVIGICLSWIFIHFRFFSEKGENLNASLLRNNSFAFTPRDSMATSMIVPNQNIKKSQFKNALSEVDSPSRLGFQGMMANSQIMEGSQMMQASRAMEGSRVLANNRNSSSLLSQTRLGQQRLERSLINILKYEEDYVLETNSRFWKFLRFIQKFFLAFLKIMYSVSSLTIFSSMIAIVIYCLCYIGKETFNVNASKGVDNPSGIYVCGLLAVGVPIFVFGGLCILGSRHSLRNKLFVYPILTVMLPLAIIVPLADSLRSDDDFRQLFDYIKYFPMAIAFLWILLIYMSFNGRRILNSLTSFFCLFFVVPLAFFHPLTYANAFWNGNDAARTIQSILLIIGGVITVLYIVFFLTRKIGYKYARNTAEEVRSSLASFSLNDIFRYNIENFSLFVTSLLFVLVISLIIFTVFNPPTYITQTQEGSLIGLFIVVFFLFLLSTLVIRMKIINVDHFKENMLMKKELLRQIKKQKLIFWGVNLVGFVVSPAITIPLIAKYNNDIKEKFILITVLVGLIFASLIFNLLFSVKKSNLQYSKSIVPGLCVYLWVFFFLPFAALYPIVFINITGEDFVQNLYQIALGLITFLILLGFSIIAVLANYYFKNVSFEKRFKYIAERLFKLLRKSHVSIDVNCMRLAFESYTNMGFDAARRKMKQQGLPLYWVKSSRFNPDTEVSKVVVSSEMFKKLKNETLNQGALKSKKGVLASCCGYLMGDTQKPEDKREEGNIQIMPNILDIEENLGDIGSEVSEEDDKIQIEDDPIQKEDNLGPLGNEMGDRLHELMIDQQKFALEFEDDQIEENYNNDSKELASLRKLNCKKIDDRILSALRSCDFSLLLAVRPEAEKDYLSRIFEAFATCMTKKSPKRYMDFCSYKEMLRLSGIIPCVEIPDHKVDLIYSDFTLKRDKELTEKYSPVFRENLRDFLTSIAESKYPNDIKEDAYIKLLRNYFWPYLLHNVPDFQGYFPFWWDYVEYLNKLYGLEFENDEEWNRRLEEVKRQIQQMKEGETLEDVRKREEEKKQVEDKRRKEEEALRRKQEEERRKQEERRRQEEERKRKEEELKLKQQEAERKRKERQKERENQKKLAIKNMREKEVKRLARMGQSTFGNSITQALAHIAYFLKSILFYKESSELEDKINLHKEIFRSQLNKNKEYEHKESPDWSAVVDMMVRNIARLDKEFQEEEMKAAESIQEYKNGLANTITLVSRVLEFLAILSLAFRTQIPWEMNLTGESIVNALNNEVPREYKFNTFKFYFWISFAFGGVLWLVGYFSVFRVKSGQFGITRVTSFWTYLIDILAFAYLSLISIAFYIFIAKSLMDAFACDYSRTPWRLYGDRDIQCHSDNHFLYVGFAIAGLILYYPLASFLYPNLQYANKGLNLRYNPGYLVAFSQAKLMIASLAAFLPFGNGAVIQLSITTLLMLCLAFFVWVTSPCLIPGFNALEIGGLICVAWMCLAGILVNETESPKAGLAFFIPGVVIILILTLYVFRRKSAIVRVGILKKSGSGLQKGGSSSVIKRNIDSKKIERLDGQGQAASTFSDTTVKKNSNFKKPMGGEVIDRGVLEIDGHNK